MYFRGALTALMLLSVSSSALCQVPDMDLARASQSTATAVSTQATKETNEEISQQRKLIDCSVSNASIAPTIIQAADRYGISRAYMLRTAQIESSCRANAQAKGSSAGGLYQFIDSTWSKYGNGGNKYDAAANADAMARFTRDNGVGLRSTLGRDATDQELYLAHQQGLGGARKLLGNPGANATSCVSASAITGNGGNLSMTCEQFARKIFAYYGGTGRGSAFTSSPTMAYGERGKGGDGITTCSSTMGNTHDDLKILKEGVGGDPDVLATAQRLGWIQAAHAGVTTQAVSCTNNLTNTLTADVAADMKNQSAGARMMQFDRQAAAQYFKVKNQVSAPTPQGSSSDLAAEVDAALKALNEGKFP